MRLFDSRCCIGYCCCCCETIIRYKNRECVLLLSAVNYYYCLTIMGFANIPYYCDSIRIHKYLHYHSQSLNRIIYYSPTKYLCEHSMCVCVYLEKSVFIFSHLDIKTEKRPNKYQWDLYLSFLCEPNRPCQCIDLRNSRILVFNLYAMH